MHQLLGNSIHNMYLLDPFSGLDHQVVFFDRIDCNVYREKLLNHGK